MKGATEILSRHISSGARIFFCWKIPRARAAALASLRKTHASTNFLRKGAGGFTLIETLVAVSLLSIAIVAPMTLVSKSLATAYYARDQVTAFHLAQEAVETVRHVRDGNILRSVYGNSTDLLSGILLPEQDERTFFISTLNDRAVDCDQGICPPLQVKDNFYGYRCSLPTSDCGNGEGWTNSRFTRTVKAETVRREDGVPQEIRITVTVLWQTGSFQSRSVEISENLYRWVEDGSGTGT